jgi:two-component system, NarL family, nitrate/nitrite response regulator NarL
MPEEPQAPDALMSAGPTVYVVDDDPAMRSSLRWLIESVGLTVRTYASAQEFLRAYQPSDPGCLVLDLRMPGMRGFDGLERVRAGWPEVPVVILSASSDKRDIEDALERGAAGYIPKSLTVAETFAALHQVLRGELFDPRVPARTREQASEVDSAGLSPRERCVLGYLAQGCSNKDIARRLDLQEVTIKAHLRQVFRKLGVANRTQAVKRVLQAGWSG